MKGFVGLRNAHEERLIVGSDNTNEVQLLAAAGSLEKTRPESCKASFDEPGTILLCLRVDELAFVLAHRFFDQIVGGEKKAHRSDDEETRIKGADLETEVCSGPVTRL